MPGRQGVWRVYSSGYEEWLRTTYWRAKEAGVPETTMKSALATIAAAGINDGDAVEVHVRATQDKSGYLIDLCDERWRVVRVTSHGWQVLDHSPVYFTRTQSMRALPEPERGGDIGLLWQHTNIPGNRRVMVLTWLLDSFRSDTPFPVLELVGEQGSAKSTTQSVLRSLVDPNKVMLRGRPKTVEDTGERIRDKIAASKAKGMWMRGVPPLGYDAVKRLLVINQAEAETVRGIWRRFVELRSTTELSRELNAQGITTKTWTNGKGVFRSGRPITKQNLYKTLRNPIYLGIIRYRGKNYPGQHEAILDQGLWDQAQAILAEEAGFRSSQTKTRHMTDAFLRGLLFAPNGDRMLPTATKKPGGKRYRYYLPYSDKKFGRGTNPFGIVPAEQIEALVLEQIKGALQAPEMIQAVWDEVRRLEPSVAEPAVVLAMRNLGAVWNELFPAERCRLVRLLIKRVQLREDGIDIEWQSMGWSALLTELAPHSIGAELRELELEEMA